MACEGRCGSNNIKYFTIFSETVHTKLNGQNYNAVVKTRRVIFLRVRDFRDKISLSYRKLEICFAFSK